MQAATKPAVAELPQIFGISLFDALILYANVYLAKDVPVIGYQDVMVPLRDLEARLRKAGHQITQYEMEAALWSCVMLDEVAAEHGGPSHFWHPNGVSLKDYINKLIQHKQRDKYFDVIYSRVKGLKNAR